MTSFLISAGSIFMGISSGVSTIVYSAILSFGLLWLLNWGEIVFHKHLIMLLLPFQPPFQYLSLISFDSFILAKHNLSNYTKSLILYTEYTENSFYIKSVFPLLINQSEKWHRLFLEFILCINYQLLIFDVLISWCKNKV